MKAEAHILSNYLVGSDASEQEQQLYQAALIAHQVTLTAYEQKVWNFVLENPWSIGSIDAALAFSEPEGNVRKKIFIMLAILETGTRNCKHFLPIGFGMFGFVRVIFSGIRAIARLIVGTILLGLI